MISNKGEYEDFRRGRTGSSIGHFRRNTFMFFVFQSNKKIVISKNPGIKTTSLSLSSGQAVRYSRELCEAKMLQKGQPGSGHRPHVISSSPKKREAHLF